MVVNSPVASDTSEAVDPDRVVQPAIVDSRPRWRRLMAPGLTAVAVGAAAAYVGSVNPNESGHYPLCPTRWFLGIDCPGCGMLRGTYSLCHGDVVGAVDNNILLILVIPFAVVLWVRWVMRAWKGTTPALTAHQASVRTRWTIGVLVAILIFGVVRNFVPYLGSGIG